MKAHPASGSQRSAAMVMAALLTLSPLAAAQQNLPELGDPSLVAMSAPQERKLGESVMREIRGSGAYLNDPEVNGYLNELGNRLVGAIPGAPFDFEFFAIADPAINAFALPGGFVAVHTGLILLTQTESELASVLGHEITHVTQHHIARSIGNQRDTMLLTTLHWPDEIRATSELDLPDEDYDFKPAELAMAKQLVSAMTGAFDPAEYKDEYRGALMQVIESKIEGHEVKTPEPVEEGGKLVDLMAALEASVNAAKAARSSEKPVSVAEAKKAREGKAATAATGSKATAAKAKPSGHAEAEAAPAKTRKRKTA